MPSIDLHANILTSYLDDELLVIIPLVGEISEMWRGRYDALARTRGIRAETHNREDSAVINLSIPVRADGSDVLRMLDAARDLVAEVEAAEQSSAVSTAPDAIAKLWWVRQQDQQPG
jgi:hypothetical protein